MMLILLNPSLSIRKHLSDVDEKSVHVSVDSPVVCVPATRPGRGAPSLQRHGGDGAGSTGDGQLPRRATREEGLPFLPGLGYRRSAEQYSSVCSVQVSSPPEPSPAQSADRARVFQGRSHRPGSDCSVCKPPACQLNGYLMVPLFV